MMYLLLKWKIKSICLYTFFLIYWKYGEIIWSMARKKSFLFMWLPHRTIKRLLCKFSLLYLLTNCDNTIQYFHVGKNLDCQPGNPNRILCVPNSNNGISLPDSMHRSRDNSKETIPWALSLLILQVPWSPSSRFGDWLSPLLRDMSYLSSSKG